MKIIKLTTLILAILILVNIASAQLANDFGGLSNLTTNVIIDGNFELSGSVADVKAMLTFIPQEDDIQKVIYKDIYANNNADMTESSDGIEYNWQTINNNEFNFGWKANIIVTNALPRIDQKIQFPLEQTTTLYTQQTETIDLTPEIRELAQSIAAGEDDLYKVAFKEAAWVQKNIRYNLTTITEKAVQKSSWVLENKQGVCDELTNLFIALMRSLGVPARFVSGMAYTNVGYEWVPHGWAEVYFPEKGWVPFDVTFGQFGWIDPGHIKLKVNEDGADASVRYAWRAHNGNLENKDINLSVSLLDEGNKITSPLEITISPLINNIGPGSYVPIEVEVFNRNEHYMPVSLVITKATDLTEPNVKAVLVEPESIEREFWITKIPENIQEGYIYTSTIEVEDQFHRNASSTITYGKNLKIITKEEAEEILLGTKQASLGLISKKLELNCLAPNKAFSYEEIILSCNIKNKAFENIRNIRVCYEINCQNIDLDINEEKTIGFRLNLKQGFHNLGILASGSSINVSEIVKINILDNPELNITNLNYPTTADYQDDFNISLTLITAAPIKDVKINVNNYEVFTLEALDAPKIMNIATSGKDLFGEDNITVQVNFKDINNKEYTVTSSYPIEIQNAPWYLRLFNWLRLI